MSIKRKVPVEDDFDLDRDGVDAFVELFNAAQKRREGMTPAELEADAADAVDDTDEGTGIIIGKG